MELEKIKESDPLISKWDIIPLVFGGTMCPQWVYSFMTRKNVAFKIRVDEQLKKDFLAACLEMDVPAAQVVRGFMREYVNKHKNSKQQDLFDILESTNRAHNG